jgi:hypothetical protein
MRPSNAIVQSDRFPQQWGEGDSEPPPGRDFTQALLRGLVQHDPGLILYSATVAEKHWEHSNWYFWVKWRSEEYRIAVAAIPESNGQWLVAVTRVNIGLFKAVFGGSREVDDRFLEILQNIIRGVAGTNEVKWVDDKEVSNLLG